MSEFPYIQEIVERVSVERKKRLDNAIFGEIKEIIKDNSLDTVIVLDETAIAEAIKKQIPKKPIANKVKAEKVKVGNGWWCKGTTIHKCPICDEYAGRTSKYCNQCGQALDWSDTE